MLIPNAKTVLAKSASLWAVYGALATIILDALVKWLSSDASAGLDPATKQTVLGVLSALAIVLRLVHQPSISGPVQPPSPLTRE